MAPRRAVPAARSRSSFGLGLAADWIGQANDRAVLFAANFQRNEMGNPASAIATLQKAGIDSEYVINTFLDRAARRVCNRWRPVNTKR